MSTATCGTMHILIRYEDGFITLRVAKHKKEDAHRDCGTPILKDAENLTELQKSLPPIPPQFLSTILLYDPWQRKLQGNETMFS